MNVQPYVLCDVMRCLMPGFSDLCGARTLANPANTGDKNNGKQVATALNLQAASCGFDLHSELYLVHTNSTPASSLIILDIPLG